MKTPARPALPIHPSDHAREMLDGMSRCYRVRPDLLLVVIVESFLDAASDDGQVQAEIAAAARQLRRSGAVPGCWLGLEGALDEEGPDDSGTGNYLDAPPEVVRALAGRGVEYGDDAAQPGEEGDNHASFRADLLPAARPASACLRFARSQSRA